MSDNNLNVQIRLISVNEVSFMMSPAKIAEDMDPESIQLGFSNQVQLDVENDRIALIFGTRYETRGEVVLESVYRFKFEVKGLAQFTKIDNDSVTITRIMPYLISVAEGTMRGILVVKTAGTNVSKFPLPMIDPNQLNANLSNHQDYIVA